MELKVHPQAKGLIFDLDGTLVDSIKLHYDSYMKALEPYGIGFDMKYMLSFTGMPTLDCSAQVVKDFNVPISAQALMEKKEQLFAQMIHLVEPIEPVMKVVREYKGKLPMGIGTGSDRFVAHEIIKRNGLDKYFDAVVTCDDVVNPKPHPETFVRCAELIGVNPTQCMVFEDGEHGMSAAREAGMWVVDVKPYYDKPIWN
ncbi:MAG: beta-phosphoglucomutase family hydrolase [Breznakibacter sp.]